MFHIHKSYEYILTSLCVLLLVSCASDTQYTSSVSSYFDEQSSSQNVLAKFGTHNSQSSAAIDYHQLSNLLDKIIFDVGFSLRSSPPTSTNRDTGTRIPRGNTSRYRLEGNRIDFDNIGAREERLVTAYRQLIENVPTRISLSDLNENEQLAYWINLHNIVLLEQLILNYPIGKASRLLVDTPSGKFNLFDAKLVTIEGVDLSLNDIRIGIVYKNWRDNPKVMYGFSTGEIGGPSFVPRAFTGRNVNQILTRNADEFVNSLRGVDSFGRSFTVSRFYNEHREVFFQNWPQDLIDHLRIYAKGEVQELLKDNSSIRYSKYDDSIIDISGGGRGRVTRLPGAPLAQATTREGTAEFGPEPAEIAAFQAERKSVQEVELRARIVRRQRRDPEGFWPRLERREGSVEIEDISTPNIDDPEAEPGDDPEDLDGSDG